MGELYPLQGSNTAEETGKDGVDERAGEGCRARAGTKSSNESLSGQILLVFPSRALSSCSCSRGELAPSPGSWPQILPSLPALGPRTAAPSQPVPIKVPFPTPACPHPSHQTQPRFVQSAPSALAKPLGENPVNLFDELPPGADTRIKAAWLLCSHPP